MIKLTVQKLYTKLMIDHFIVTRSEGYWGLYYYQGDGVDHYAWNCNSGHKSLSQCSYYYHSNCYHNHDQFGIACYPNVQGKLTLNYLFFILHSL